MADVDVVVELDRAGAPLPVQIAAAVRDLIDRQVLRPGDRLPATRGLAGRLQVSRGTVLAAWDQLIAEGYLSAAQGSGTVVDPVLALTHPGRFPLPAAAPEPGAAATQTPAADVDLRPGRPDVGSVADGTWRRAWRDAAADAGPTSLDPIGPADLRAELATYLRQLRGVLVPADDIIVTTGARDGLAAVLQALPGRRGGRDGLTIAVEDPGYPSLRQVPERLGVAVRPVPVDAEGLVVRRLGDIGGGPPPDAVLVTPSHQYPMGASMTVARRLELLAWARRHDAVVIEDDYASELRYVGAPLPALAALDRRDHPRGDRVVTLGSFSKTVSPALGVGFLLVPAPLRAAVVQRRTDLGPVPSAIAQRAFAGWLADGGLQRHLQRMRRTYRRRRQIVADGLGGLDTVTVRTMDGGLHAVIEWTTPDPSGPSDDRAAPASRETDTRERLAAEGIAVGTLSEYWSHGSTPERHGLVVGYAGVDDAVLAGAVATVRRVLTTGTS